MGKIKSLLRRMKNLLRKIKNKLVNAKKKQNGNNENIIRLEMFQKRYKQHKKIKVLFYSDLPSLWNSFDPLYRELKSDEMFEVDVLALPELYDSKYKNYDICSYLESKDYKYIRGYNKDENKYIDFKYEDYDYLFPNRPYDWLRPKQYSNEELRKRIKLCHITYSTCMHKGKILDIVCGFQHLYHYDMVFSETPIHTNIYYDMKKKAPPSDTQILTVGSTKFDLVMSDKKNIENGMFTVLYTPRWSLREGTSSFLDLYNYLFDLANENSDIYYIFRPHPLMEQEYRRELWKAKEWDEFVQRFDQLPNARIDLQGDYIKTFNESDVLISDISSMFAEYMLTDKPIIYMDKADMLNEFGENIAKGMYWCKNSEDVDKIIKDLKNGCDSLSEIRKELINENYIIDDENSSVKIKKLLIDDFNRTKRGMK